MFIGRCRRRSQPLNDSDVSLRRRELRYDPPGPTRSARTAIRPAAPAARCRQFPRGSSLRTSRHIIRPSRSSPHTIDRESLSTPSKSTDCFHIVDTVEKTCHRGGNISPGDDITVRGASHGSSWPSRHDWGRHCIREKSSTGARLVAHQGALFETLCF